MLWVLFFGLFGVGSRYGVDTLFNKWTWTFPWHTLAINIVGCFLAGWLFGRGGADKDLNPIQFAMIVGFCGGFTTYSGFGLQVFKLFQEQRVLTALAYGGSTPILCVAATGLGIYIAQYL